METTKSILSFAVLCVVVRIAAGCGVTGGSADREERVVEALHT
jgi:hypothetical protein